MTVGFSYSLVEANCSNTVNMFENGGFYIEINGDTDETVEDLSLFVTILENDTGLPIKQICKYEDDENCYLYKTDANGRSEGLFYIGNELQVGYNYTLRMSVGNVTNDCYFNVTTLRDLSYTADWTIWLKDNFIWILLVLVVAFFCMVAIGFFLNPLGN